MSKCSLFHSIPVAAVGSACQVSRHCRLVNVGSCDGPTVSDDSSRVGAALAAMLACVSVTHSGLRGRGTGGSAVCWQ